VKDLEFKELYETHRQKVFRLCMGYFKGNEEIAQDITQDVFIKIWKKQASFRGDAKITTWIYRITVNTCLMYLRTHKKKKEIKVDFISDMPDSSAADSKKEEQLKKLYACIYKLDELNRIIILMILEGLSYAKIAEVSGVSEDTLRVRIHRIKKKLTNCGKNG